MYNIRYSDAILLLHEREDDAKSHESQSEPVREVKTSLTIANLMCISWV